MEIADLERISDCEWQIAPSYRYGMRVPVRLFATREILARIMDDKSLEQAVNATFLPGLAAPVIVMPDMHQGYGFPIGGVAATEMPHGVVSPGAIGYDINCGVRLLSSRIEAAEASSELPHLADLLNQYCPSGVGKAGGLKLGAPDLDKVLGDGSAWAVKHGYGTKRDEVRTEERGHLELADPGRVSAQAKARGRPQVGSLGSGNHFIEVDIVEQVFDLGTASVFGLHAGCLAVQIHCGSRGLGHQICTDYVQQFQGAIRKYGIQLPDRELVCAPLDSPEGQAYMGAMAAAANFAFVNRQLLAQSARRAFEDAFRGRVPDPDLTQVYDVAHNMGKIETHATERGLVRVCVHRKGATRAFGPGTPGLPEEFQATGQPVLVPGSMGTGSWVLAGTEASMQESLGSCCHGAGRIWSRSKAKKEVRGETLLRSLTKQGIEVRAGSMPGLAEEAPEAYKDVDEVVKVVVAVGIARKVARLRPLIVIKG